MHNPYLCMHSMGYIATPNVQKCPLYYYAVISLAIDTKCGTR